MDFLETDSSAPFNCSKRSRAAALTAGDGFFTYSGNSRDIDHYAVYDLHVGQFIGTQHQIYKNLFDIPVL